MLTLSTPVIYSLELTPACNNRCPGCSNVYSAHRSPAILDGAAWEWILEMIGPEAVRLRLSGGEPTLHPAFGRILDQACAYSARVTVFTNGRWSEPAKLVEQVRAHRDRTGLLISLHGATPAAHEAFTQVPGSFQETLANIRLARAAGIEVALSTVLTRHNLHQIDELVRLAESLEVEHAAFNRYIGPALDSEPDPAALKQAFTRIEELIQADRPARYGIGVPQCFFANSSEGCLAGVAYASIDPWGYLHPCSHSPTTIGSVFSKSVEALWSSITMQKWRGAAPQECLECEAFAVCHGGCRANAELRKGRDSLCMGPARDFIPSELIHKFPAAAYPALNVRLRRESFGFAVLGEGQVLPVAAEGKALIEACDGSATFAEIAEKFGQDGLDLLGDFWSAGMLRVNAEPA